METMSPPLLSSEVIWDLVFPSQKGRRQQKVVQVGLGFFDINICNHDAACQGQDLYNTSS